VSHPTEPTADRDAARPTEPAVVVAAAIVRDGCLLAARRSAPSALAGGWELAGGKVEPGESEHDALVREIREELGVGITVGARLGGDWALMPGYVLRVYRADIVAGEPVPQPLEDHDEIRWLEPGAWFDVAWLTADLPVVEALLAEG
jgi:8-oxo-dGTP diphosphatase